MMESSYNNTVIGELHFVELPIDVSNNIMNYILNWYAYADVMRSLGLIRKYIPDQNKFDEFEKVLAIKNPTINDISKKIFGDNGTKFLNHVYETIKNHPIIDKMIKQHHQQEESTINKLSNENKELIKKNNDNESKITALTLEYTEKNKALEQECDKLKETIVKLSINTATNTVPISSYISNFPVSLSSGISGSVVSTVTIPMTTYGGNTMK